MSKLCGGYDFDAQKTNHVLTVLEQRFRLNVTFGHLDSVEHLETGVASHLRIFLATTPDRNWRFTSYPSKPLLSCIATSVLHKGPETLKLALGSLLKVVNSGMIDVGRGLSGPPHLLTWWTAFLKTPVPRVAPATNWPCPPECVCRRNEWWVSWPSDTVQEHPWLSWYWWRALSTAPLHWRVMISWVDIWRRTWLCGRFEVEHSGTEKVAA